MFFREHLGCFVEPALNLSEPTELSGGDLHPKSQMTQNVQNMGKFLVMLLGSGAETCGLGHPNWSLLTKNSHARADQNGTKCPRLDGF